MLWKRRFFLFNLCHTRICCCNACLYAWIKNTLKSRADVCSKLISHLSQAIIILNVSTLCCKPATIRRSGALSVIYTHVLLSCAPPNICSLHSSLECFFPPFIPCEINIVNFRLAFDDSKGVFEETMKTNSVDKRSKGTSKAERPQFSHLQGLVKFT